MGRGIKEAVWVEQNKIGWNLRKGAGRTQWKNLPAQIALMMNTSRRLSGRVQKRLNAITVAAEPALDLRRQFLS